MKKYFKNTVTGNIIAAKNDDAANLMETSDRYVPVVKSAARAKRPTAGKKKASTRGK